MSAATVSRAGGSSPRVGAAPTKKDRLKPKTLLLAMTMCMASNLGRLASRAAMRTHSRGDSSAAICERSEPWSKVRAKWTETCLSKMRAKWAEACFEDDCAC